MTYGEAVQDTNTKLGSDAAALKERREEAIAAWMAKGYTREEAYNAALFGFRKSSAGVDC